VGILVNGNRSGIAAAAAARVHATFIQKVLICMFAGFLAASLYQWGMVFIEGADDALNKGYEHHSVMGPSKP
jgi:nucleoside recognition membrane protein YjiH